MLTLYLPESEQPYSNRVKISKYFLVSFNSEFRYLKPPVTAALRNIPSKQFTSLGLGKNGLSSIPFLINISIGKTVERLNLAGNYFQSLWSIFNFNFFPGMSGTLKYLILKRCQIEHIDKGRDGYRIILQLS